MKHLIYKVTLISHNALIGFIWDIYGIRIYGIWDKLLYGIRILREVLAAHSDDSEFPISVQGHIISLISLFQDITTFIIIECKYCKNARFGASNS